MARSYTASEGRAAFGSSPQYTKSYSKDVVDVVRKLKANKDARTVISDMFEAINEYQRTTPQNFDWQKPDEDAKTYGRNQKLMVAELVKKLPPDIRRAIEAPRSMIGKLYRGVKERKETEAGNWVNGKFVYGFSPDKEIAIEFAGGNYENKVKLVTKDDIESFGGIISVQKLYAVTEAFNRLLWGNDKTFDRQYSSPTEEGWRSASQKKQTEYAMNSFSELEDKWKDEKEYLVYDLKYKSSFMKP